MSATCHDVVLSLPIGTLGSAGMELAPIDSWGPTWRGRRMEQSTEYRLEYMLGKAERALEDVHLVGSALRVVIANLQAEIGASRSLPELRPAAPDIL